MPLSSVDGGGSADAEQRMVSHGLVGDLHRMNLLFLQLEPLLNLITTPCRNSEAFKVRRSQ